MRRLVRHGVRLVAARAVAGRRTGPPLGPRDLVRLGVRWMLWRAVRVAIVAIVVLVGAAMLARAVADRTGAGRRPAPAAIR